MKKKLLPAANIPNNVFGNIVDWSFRSVKYLKIFILNASL